MLRAAETNPSLPNATEFLTSAAVLLLVLAIVALLVYLSRRSRRS